MKCRLHLSLEVPAADTNAELSLFVQPFIDRFGYKKGGVMCPLYIAGLLGLGDRQSIEPMAARLAP